MAIVVGGLFSLLTFSLSLSLSGLHHILIFFLPTCLRVYLPMDDNKCVWEDGSPTLQLEISQDHPTVWTLSPSCLLVFRSSDESSHHLLIMPLGARGLHGAVLAMATASWDWMLLILSWMSGQSRARCSSTVTSAHAEWLSKHMLSNRWSKQHGCLLYTFLICDICRQSCSKMKSFSHRTICGSVGSKHVCISCLWILSWQGQSLEAFWLLLRLFLWTSEVLNRPSILHSMQWLESVTPKQPKLLLVSRGSLFFMGTGGAILIYSNDASWEPFDVLSAPQVLSLYSVSVICHHFLGLCLLIRPG